jgi:hypothetical protein
LPSASRITPGFPITRWTKSNWVVDARPGVTRQSPRMFSTIEAAAPGWPSASTIMALLDRMLSTTITSSSASMTPTTSQTQLQPIVTSTVPAMSGKRVATITSGTNSLSRLAVNEKTMPI